MTADFVAELNARYAIVDVGSMNSDTVVAEICPDTGRVVTLRPFHAFRRHLINAPRVKVGDEEFKSRADAWLTHPKARRFSRLVYAPPGSALAVEPPSHTYNTWRGFALDPAPGDWTALDEFIRRIVCAGDHDLYWWLLAWLAALVQRPGQHAHTALVLKGGQGIGKGFFVERVVGGLFHRDDWVQLTDPTRLTQQFNSLLANKVLVFADEAVWDTARNANKLKGVITADTMQIERKLLPIEDVPSTMHLIVASNSDQPLPVERDDRRLCIFQVDESRKQDTAYFAHLQAVLNSGALAAFLADLMEWPIDDALLRTPPDSAAKQQMKAHSLPVEDAWWGEMLAEADPSQWGDGTRRLARATLFDELRDYAKQQGRRTQTASTQQLGNYFAQHFKRGGLSSWPKAGRDLKVFDFGHGKRINAWEFPALNLCRQAFERATGVKGDW